MKKKIYITIMFFLFLLLFTIPSMAAGNISLKPSKSSLTVGE